MGADPDEGAPSETELDSAELDASVATSPSVELLRRVAMGDRPRADAADEDLSGGGLGPPVGDRPGRFELLRRLGRGGFGAVYEAFDHGREARLALKVLAGSGARDVFLFKQEFRGLAELRHPNLIRLHELHTDGARWYFTMTLVDGVPFDAWVRPDGRLDVTRLRDALRQLVRALHHLHARGRVHRDVKPPNVLVDRDGHLLLLDFGLASTVDAVGFGLIPGRGAGTRRYLAPENASGAALGPPADLYAVGVMLHGALTGRLRPAADPAADPAAELRRAGAPADLAALAAALLSDAPSARPDAAAVLRELGRRPTANALSARDDGLVGRGDALARLWAAWEGRRDGRSRLVLVEGPSGIGKSALVDAHLDALAGEDPAPLALRGRCHAEESVPYKALDGVVDQLAQHLVSGEATARAALARPEAAALVRAFPVLAGVLEVPPADAAADGAVASRAAAGLRALLGGLAADRPIALVIDDLQWGDADGGALIEALLSARGAARPLHVVATLRPDAPDTAEVPRPPWLRALVAALRERRGAVQVEVVALDALAPAEATHLAATLLAGDGGPLDVDAAARIARAADGNPLLIRELARWVRLDAPDGAAALTGAAPTLEAMVARKMEALPAAARRLLETACLAGQPVDRRVAAEAAEVDDEPAAIAALDRARLAVVDGVGEAARLAPFHDRIRRAVCEGLPAARRGAALGRLAAVAEARGGVGAATLGAWYREAGDREREVACWVAAGQRAAGLASFERAVELLARARALLDDADPRVGEVCAGLGDALGVLGRTAAAAEAYREAAARSAGDEALDLRRRAADMVGQSGEIEACQALARRVLEDVGVRAPRTGVGALVAWLRARRGVRRRGLGFEAAPVDRRRRLVLDARLTAGMAWSHTDFLRSWAVLTRGLSDALGWGDAERVADFVCIEIGLAALRGGEERSPWQRAVQVAAEPLVARFPEVRGRYETARALSAFCHGDWAMAADCARRAETALAERRYADLDVHFARIFGLEALYLSGRWRELTARLGEVAAAYAGGGTRYFAEIVDLQTGWLADLLDDRPEAARARVQDVSKRTPAVDRTARMGRFVALADIALYESAGVGSAAQATLRQTWGPLKRSGMLTLFPVVRVVAESVRLRAALAAGRDRAVARARRRLARSGAEQGAAWSAVAAASAARAEGADAVAAALADAEVAFEGRGMRLHVAACRWRRGQAVGGERGRARIESAEVAIAAECDLPPARVVAMLLPGEWPAS